MKINELLKRDGIVITSSIDIDKDYEEIADLFSKYAWAIKDLYNASLDDLTDEEHKKRFLQESKRQYEKTIATLLKLKEQLNERIEHFETIKHSRVFFNIKTCNEISDDIGFDYANVLNIKKIAFDKSKHLNDEPDILKQKEIYEKCLDYEKSIQQLNDIISDMRKIEPTINIIQANLNRLIQ
jgi:hypothetical protein